MFCAQNSPIEVHPAPNLEVSLPNPQTETEKRTLRKGHDQRDGQRLFRRVMACLDRSPDAARVLEEAASIADLFEATLTSMRVIPRDGDASPCADPVEWELTRREEIAGLRSLGETTYAAADMEVIVACGPIAECIHEEARKAQADLLVLGNGAVHTSKQWGLGGTVHHIAETSSGSVLIVPCERNDERPKRPRIIVPVDGSAHSEAALRLASTIASKRAAELVILHAVPEAALAGDDQSDPEDEGLIRKLNQREQRVADDRLQRMRRLLPTDSHRHRVRRLGGEDPRHALLQAICEEHGELVVLSARGLGRNPDLRIGSTAEYLISRAVVPTLLVRDSATKAHHVVDLAPLRPARAQGPR